MGKPAPTVVVASDDPALLDEIVRHLEALPSWHLAGWARTAAELRGLLADHTPDAALMSPGIARELDPARTGKDPAGTHADGNGTRLVIVATEQELGILRCSLRLGARFVLWPRECDDLRRIVETGAPRLVRHRSRLLAVWGPKGGSGATVLAAHLAGAVAPLAPCMLVDLDLRHGDQRILLGAGDHPRSFIDIIDLIAAGDDVSPSAVKGVAWDHPAGFGVTLAPPPAPRLGGPAPAHPWSGVAAVLDATGTIGAGRGVLVADLPSGLGDISLEMAERADATAIVVTPDLLALRRAREAARAVGERPEVGVILNRWSRGAGVLSPGDVEAVLKLPVWASVPVQAGLLRALDLGRLSRPACRALEPLAIQLVSAGIAEGRRTGADAAAASGGGHRDPQGRNQRGTPAVVVAKAGGRR